MTFCLHTCQTALTFWYWRLFSYLTNLSLFSYLPNLFSSLVCIFSYPCVCDLPSVTLFSYLPNCSDLLALETILSSLVELPAPESVELLESLGEDVNSWSFTVNLTTCAYQITIKNLNLKLKNSVETGVYFLGNFPKVYGNQVLVFE